MYAAASRGVKADSDGSLISVWCGVPVLLLQAMKVADRRRRSPGRR
jgi:hypothetical protein